MAFKSGGSGDDTLAGSAAMDTLQGYAGSDRLAGRGGNDLLIGGIGGDSLLGGSGNDLLMAEGALPVGHGGIMVKPAGFPNSSLAMATGVDGAFNLTADSNIDKATTRPHATVEGTGDGSVDYYAFTVTTAGSNATFDIDGAWPGFDAWLQLMDAAGNVLTFNDDGLTDPGSIEVYPSFSRDSFITCNFADTGTYIIAVGAYANLQPIPADTGYDLHISLDHGTGRMTQGPDTLKGGSGADTLIGGAGGDRLWGGAGNDKMTGKRGADHLHGGSGADALRGGGGRDTLAGGADDDRLVSGAGADRAHGGSGADTLKGGGGNDRLWGGLNDDRLLGGAGGDRLHGGPGADRLKGGNGADHLVGGSGRDILSGGEGDDVFVFRKPADSPAGSGRDRISDFSPGSDHIDLSPIDADPGQSGDDAFTFIGEAAFSHHAGELRYHHAASATIVTGDIDGDGHGDFKIALAGVLTLNGGDFLL